VIVSALASSCIARSAHLVSCHALVLHGLTGLTTERRNLSVVALTHESREPAVELSAPDYRPSPTGAYMLHVEAQLELPTEHRDVRYRRIYFAADQLTDGHFAEKGKN
jgi:hypothetical protein